MGCQSVSRNVAYCLAPEPAPQDLAITTMLNNLPERARDNLACCIDQHGDDTLRLALFMDWVQQQVNLDNVNTTNGIAGIGATILGNRTNSFMAALQQYQGALIKLNQFSRVGRGPAATKMQLRKKVKISYEQLNRYFQQELHRLAPASHFGKNRGTAITGADRGITLAERHKGRGIHIADIHEGQAVSRFSRNVSYAGRGIIAVDLGFRGHRVYQTYQENGEWERELAVQTGGFAGASGAGFITGRTVALTMARVALAATPWGWAFMIGSSIAIGAIAAYQLDERAQSVASRAWDRWVN